MIDARERLRLPSGESTTYYSLTRLERSGVASLSRLPVSIRVLLESVLRNRDGRRVRDEAVLSGLRASWSSVGTPPRSWPSIWRCARWSKPSGGAQVAGA
jgi:aconitase A